MRQEAVQLTGTQIRALRPRPPESVEALSPKAGAYRAASQMLEEIAKVYLKKMGQDMDTIIGPKTSPRMNDALREHMGRIGNGLGMPRDADGNVLHVDENDRPYVLVNDGKIVYVKVYKARINTKGQQLTAQCTVENPDGFEEVLLVEPVPVLEAADTPSL